MNVVEVGTFGLLMSDVPTICEVELALEVPFTMGFGVVSNSAGSESLTMCLKIFDVSELPDEGRDG